MPKNRKRSASEEAAEAIIQQVYKVTEHLSDADYLEALGMIEDHVHAMADAKRQEMQEGTDEGARRRKAQA